MSDERYLLDTCALLYLMAGSDEMPASLLNHLETCPGRIFYSPVNLIEIQIKYQLGKLHLTEEPDELMPRELARHPFDRLDLSDSAIFAMQRLPLLHRDPFDRLLIAQAMHDHCVLLTPDQKICQYDVQTLWK